MFLFKICFSLSKYACPCLKIDYHYLEAFSDIIMFNVEIVQYVFLTGTNFQFSKYNKIIINDVTQFL